MFGLRAFIHKSLVVPDILKAQSRNTFILRRKWPPPLHKQGGKVTKLRGRHFVYELEKDLNVQPKPDIKVVLTQFVDGVGKVGDVLSMKPQKAYKELLMPGLAVYAQPENIEKYRTATTSGEEEEIFSSPYAQRTISCLSRLVLQITMSKSEPWTLEKWHLKASFRKTGYVVPEDAIEMPPREIKGPDLSLQDKEFYVTVTVNNKEKVNVRCRIHHWATGLNRLPWAQDHWLQAREPLFPEQAEVLAQIPLLTNRLQ